MSPIEHLLEHYHREERPLWVRTLAMLNSGKMRESTTRIGHGMVDTTQDAIARLNRWISENDAIAVEYSGKGRTPAHLT